jgi:hypothetical protein
VRGIREKSFLPVGGGVENINNPYGVISVKSEVISIYYYSK